MGSLTYHPTCHSLRLLEVGERPESLLRAVPGVDLRPLDEATECCGFGGTFAIKNAQVSSAMLADKLRQVGGRGPARCARATHRACCTSAVGWSGGKRGARRAPGRGARLVGAAASRSALPVSFEEAAPAALEDAQTRANVLRATTSIRARRAAVVSR